MGRREFHVLLVEDSPGDARLVREYLTDAKSERFSMHQCDRLDSALAYVADSAVDVVLLDLGLPDSQGLDTFRRMRDAVRGAPVVVLTGNADQALALSAVGEGAQDYLVKGEVTSESITRSIRYALERSRTEEGLRESEERFRTLYENATIGLYRTTPDGAIVLANPALVRMLGFSSSDELLVRNLEVDGFEPSYPRSGFVERIEKEGTVKALDATWTRRDGTALIVRESARAIRDSDGKTLFYDGTVEDITERRQAEEALSKSESKYRDLVENLNDVIFTVDLAGIITYVSPPVRQLAGYAPEQLVGHPFGEIIHSDDLPGLDRRFREILENRLEPWEFRYRTKAGEIRWARTSSRPIVESGRLVGIRGMLSNITEHKHAEEGIRASQARLEEAQRTAHLGSWEMDLITGQTTWSDELCRLFEIPPETIRAGTSQLRAAIDERIHPDDRARYTQAVARTVDQKMPYDIDYRIQLPDGSQRHIHAQGAPSSDPAGNVVRLAGTAIDITERKKAEHALRESEDRYRSLVDNVPGIIFTIDLAGKITFVTRRVKDTLGYESAEVINKSVLDFIPEEERKRAMEAIQKGMTGVGIKRFETPMMKRSGERAWFECSFTRVRRDGAVIGAQGTAVDISERKHGEAERNRLLARQVTLNRVTLALGALTELPAILRTLHDEVRTLLDADGFFVSRYHTGTQLITALFAIDEGGERDVSTFPPIPLAPEGRGMQSQVLRTAKPLKVPDWIEGEHRMQTVHHIAADGTFTPPPPETERDGCTKSALLVPLMFQGEPIGVLQVQSNRLNAYSHEDENLLGGLANVAAISIQNALLIAEAQHAADELRRSLEGTLRAVSRASETRDPYTAGHQHRVTNLALAIARELGLSDDGCEALRAGGLTHDIGKLGIPAEILSKPGMLAPIELALIREHPQTAYDILADVPFPGPVAEIVLQHHERLDGSGYPRGLTGEQTLREARILAVADVVEAMASHRPYRPARGIDAALGEIEQNAGRLYDSEAVQACIHLFRDKGYALPA